MIKRGDKGTVDGRPARVIEDNLSGTQKIAIAIKGRSGQEYVERRRNDGTSRFSPSFIPSRPWDSLKPGDACYAKSNIDEEWGARVFSGVNEDGEPEVFIGQGRRWVFQYLVPAKLIDGELVPVEEE